MVARLEREDRRLADQLDDDRILLGRSVRRVLGRRIRHPVEQRLAPLVGLVEALLELLQLHLHAPQLLELLRRRLALQLRARAERVDLRRQLEPLSVGREQLVERLGRSLARERRPVGLGIVTRGAEVDHAAECTAGTARDSVITGVRDERRRRGLVEPGDDRPNLVDGPVGTDDPRLEVDQPVAVADARHPVRDDDHRHAALKLSQRVDDVTLGRLVEIRRRLVEHQHASASCRARGRGRSAGADRRTAERRAPREPCRCRREAP